MALKPFEWKDRPALIEHLFPVQKISVESFKEQMAGSGKTLTALGSYWKGRKPLILNKACILGSLLPATDDHLRDLEIFEMLMGMDMRSMAIRHGRIKPGLICQRVSGLKTRHYFKINPEDAHLPEFTPFNLNDYPCVIKVENKEETKIPKLEWLPGITEEDRLEIEAMALPFKSYQENVSAGKRPEEIADEVHNHIWAEVNAHLGTDASSFSELVEQIGIARFGHRPKVADVFCGSGQIPFEAARLGCDVYASDLNPIACLLTWGAFNIIGTSKERMNKIERSYKQLAEQIQNEIYNLDFEIDGHGWRAKAFLYCVEVKCPETGWMVPLIPSFIVNQPQGGSKNNVVVNLVPVPTEKRYNIDIIEYVNDEEMIKYKKGTIQNGEVIHSTDGQTIHRIKLSAIRGDFIEEKETKNRLRLWEKYDYIPSIDDIFQERLYCILWMRKKESGKGAEYKFSSITPEDIDRENAVISCVGSHLKEWQDKGYIPDMVIEKGDETERLYRERGWTHWHHLFNPRQLFMLKVINSSINKIPEMVVMFPAILNLQSKLCVWHSGRFGLQNTFLNQALNTLFNYGSRGSIDIIPYLYKDFSQCVLQTDNIVKSHPAQDLEVENDIYITDPPYGDAVKYEEITEFFIAWLRKNPPSEFAHWNWDSRRSLAVKGEDEGFRRGMIAAYRKTAEKMPDNGIQVLMFTHQSGSIWADMANIIWASGLQVTAAWYVVTETDSALRQGANVTGTVMLVLRKRHKILETFRDDLGWEIERSVKEQVESLIGLDKTVREQRAEGLYADSDLQMAGYAAALKVLTAYSVIDGKNMVTESEAPRVNGKKTFVDELIEFAVQTAVKFLVPVGFEEIEWQKLSPVERYYLKMAEMEHQGNKTLDNYQNFAKAFKVRHFDQLVSDSSKANSARLKLSTEFKSSMMSGDAEVSSTPLRALLYAMYEVTKEVEVDDVLLHLMENCQNYLQNKSLLSKMADYLAEKRNSLKPTKTFRPDLEASAARVIAEAIRNQRL